MKNKFLILSLLVVAGMLLAACGAAQPTGAPAPQATPAAGSGGSQYVLDPANAAGEKALAAVGYVYEGLVRVQDGNVTGALAESFEVSDDGLDYIFNLRPDVTFHDGSALNADVVIANFNRWFDPKDANRGSGKFEAWAKAFGGFKGETTTDGKPKSRYDGIEKVNDFTVLVHLNMPDPDLLTKLSSPAFSIVSPKAFAGGDGGTGPYKISAGSDKSLTLEPFAKYWYKGAIPSKGMEAPLK